MQLHIGDKIVVETTTHVVKGEIIVGTDYTLAGYTSLEGQRIDTEDTFSVRCDDGEVFRFKGWMLTEDDITVLEPYPICTETVFT